MRAAVSRGTWDALKARWANPLLFGWFVLIDVLLVVRWLQLDAFAGNVQTYDAAAKVWLAGGDPWGQLYPTTFGPQAIIAPPPSLAPFLLTAGLPLQVTTWLWVVVAAAAVIAVVRTLHLPWLWLAFPPLALSVFWASADPLIMVFLLTGPRWLAGFAKATFIPALVAEKAWRDIAIALTLLAASLFVMPWGAFISHLPELSRAAFFQSQGGLSAWSIPPVAVATAIALASMGWRRGWYLLVPGLWPASQLGYSMVSMPVLAALPLMSMALATQTQYVAPLAIIATAVWLRRGDIGLGPRRVSEPRRIENG